jgi:hypothetical protein
MMDRIYGNQGWHSIYERRLNDVITTQEATDLYVQLYAAGLRNDLGYKSAFGRAIRDKGIDGRLRYFLVFATDHPAGEKIMRHIFDTVYAPRPVTAPKKATSKRDVEGQVSLFDMFEQED